MVLFKQKNAAANFWATLDKIGLLWKALGYFGKNWATFYFNICSLLFPSFEILLCSMPLIYVMEKLFSVTEIRTLGCLQSNCL